MRRQLSAASARLVALALPLFAACTVAPVDFSGKTCAEGDCPSGYSCDPASKTCVKDGDSPPAPPDASTPVLPPDASTQQMIPDDAGTPDAATVITCTDDNGCKSLGAFFCSAGVCTACDVDDHCGTSCSSCGAGTYCSAGSCATCNVNAKCGSSCAPCAAPTPVCAGSSCVECLASSDCPASAPVCRNQKCAPCAMDSDCAAGTFCSTGSCVKCDVASHCGPTCTTCAGATPGCDGTKCVTCSDDRHCGPGTFCQNFTCVSCGKFDDHCGMTCTACSGATPLCDGNRCTACAVDADCATSKSGKFCISGACVPCKADGDCGAGNFCAPDHSCAACNTDAHCGSACSACSGTTPKCGGAACVECVADADCGPGKSCCQNKCLSGVPTLVAVQPRSVTVGATGVTLTLQGTNFNACSQVNLGPAPLKPLSVTPTTIQVPVPDALLTRGGSQPVQVVNPGPGGGASNPPSLSLGSPLKFTSGTPVAAAAAGDDLFIALYRARTIQIASGGAMKLQSSFNSRSAPVLASMLGKALFVGLECCSDADLVSSPSTLFRTTAQLNLLNDPVALGVDHTTGEGLIAERNRSMQLISSTGLGTGIKVSTAPCCEFTGAGWDSALGVGVLPVDSGPVLLVDKTGTVLSTLGTSNTKNAGAVVDPSTHRAYVAQAASVAVIDLKTQTALPSIPVPNLNDLELNRASGLLLGTTLSGSYSLAVVDLTTQKLIGYVGAGGGRGCGAGGGNKGRHEALAIDPLSNHAFSGLSCDDAVEGFNMNALFVNYPEPSVTGVSPGGLSAGVGSTLFTVTGSNFVPGTTLQVVSASATSYSVPVQNLTPTSFQALVPTPALSCPGPVTFRVTNPQPLGATAQFTITLAGLAPRITSVSPTFCPYTSSCFMTVSGSNFYPGCSRIVASGQSLDTTGGPASVRSVTALQPVSGPGSAPLYVSTPYVGISNTVTITR